MFIGFAIETLQDKAPRNAASTPPVGVFHAKRPEVLIKKSAPMACYSQALPYGRVFFTTFQEYHP